MEFLAPFIVPCYACDDNMVTDLRSSTENLLHEHSSYSRPCCGPSTYTEDFAVIQYAGLSRKRDSEQYPITVPFDLCHDQRIPFATLFKPLFKSWKRSCTTFQELWRRVFHLHHEAQPPQRPPFDQVGVLFQSLEMAPFALARGN